MRITDGGLSTGWEPEGIWDGHTQSGAWRFSEEDLKTGYKRGGQKPGLKLEEQCVETDKEVGF